MDVAPTSQVCMPPCFVTDSKEFRWSLVVGRSLGDNQRYQVLWKLFRWLKSWFGCAHVFWGASFDYCLVGKFVRLQIVIINLGKVVVNHNDILLNCIFWFVKCVAKHIFFSVYVYYNWTSSVLLCLGNGIFTVLWGVTALVSGNPGLGWWMITKWLNVVLIGSSFWWPAHRLLQH